jgi:hypothetical protein
VPETYQLVTLRAGRTDLAGVGAGIGTGTAIAGTVAGVAAALA